MKEKKACRVDIEETNGVFKASFFVNGRLIHKTYPQHSKQNAVMLSVTTLCMEHAFA